MYSLVLLTRPQDRLAELKKIKDTVTELKTGTEDNQHVVGVEQKGKSTHFALVYVRVRGDHDNTM